MHGWRRLASLPAVLAIAALCVSRARAPTRKLLARIPLWLPALVVATAISIGLSALGVSGQVVFFVGFVLVCVYTSVMDHVVAVARLGSSERPAADPEPPRLGAHALGALGVLVVGLLCLPLVGHAGAALAVAGLVHLFVGIPALCVWFTSRDARAQRRGRP